MFGDFVLGKLIFKGGGGGVAAMAVLIPHRTFL